MKLEMVLKLVENELDFVWQFVLVTPAEIKVLGIIS